MSGSGVYTLSPTGERIYEGQSLFGSTPDFDDPDFEVKQPGHSTKNYRVHPTHYLISTQVIILHSFSQAR